NHVRPARRRLPAGAVAVVRRRQRRSAVHVGVGTHGHRAAAARAADSLITRGVYYEGFFVGEVAQSAEGRRLVSGYGAKSSVQGSNPCPSAMGPLAQVDRASDYESEGQRFESSRAHHSLDEAFMREALDEARQGLVEGEVPIGAVVVLDGEIVGRAPQSPLALPDPP